MKRTFSYFLGNDYLGSVIQNPLVTSDGLVPRPGLVFFCPLCHDIWFRALSEGEASTATHRFCAKHLPGESLGGWSHGRVWQSDIPGSIWRQEDKTWNLSLPPAALEWELGVTLRWLTLCEAYDREVKDSARDLIHRMAENGHRYTRF